MSRRLSTTLRFAVLGLLVATPVLARPPHSPDDQYEAFVESSTLIVDTKTRLTWERSVTSTTADWDTADDYCRLTFGGRLPTIKELLTLFDEEPHDEYDGQLVPVYIDPDAFGYKTPVDAPYWTSTPANTQGTQVWTLDFKSGEMTAAPKAATTTDKRHYRCVKP